MLKQPNTKDKTTAQTILTIQHLAYRIEADLIGFNGIPPLHETIDDILNSEETFIGYYVEDVLAGALSYSVDDAILDIGRLIVHPDYFRRGIAKKLVQSVDTVESIQKIIVSTGALNHPARRLYEKLGYKLVEEIMLPEGVEIACYEKPCRTKKAAHFWDDFRLDREYNALFKIVQAIRGINFEQFY